MIRKRKKISQRENFINGFSLIETMVVLVVFALLAIIAAQAILSTLRASNKSETITRIRAELDYAVSAIERNLHGATEIKPCPLVTNQVVNYKDSRGTSASFSCITSGTDIYIASGSARLTSDDLNITSCSFSCTPASGGTQPVVNISFSAKDKKRSGIESAAVTFSTQIYLRTY